MTDNEIIKALECCRCESVLCSQCPLKDVGHNCEDKLTGYAFCLINRQKGEIETLKAERNNYKEWYFDTVEQLKTAKSEAIKEFAERLKQSFLDLDVQINTGKRKTVPVDEYIKQSEWLLHEVAIQDIDSLVEEMMEEKGNA